MQICLRPVVPLVSIGTAKPLVWSMRGVGACRRIAVGMSGGVDSAVTAALLKQEGHEVLGVHMTNWDHEEEHTTGCEGQEALDFAARNCAALGIPLHRVNFVQDYWNHVFSEVVEQYQRGLYTPNPDVLCNVKIKFSRFTDHVLRELGADMVATGHYSQLKNDSLFRGIDPIKDQSYFLSMVPRHCFSNVVFPLGDKTKAEVKKIAADLSLPSATRRESMGLCFVGKRKNFASFLGEYVDPQYTVPGDLVDIDTNRVLGRHKGLWTLTIGQRCRIGGLVQPGFVAAKDTALNRIMVAQGTDHPALFSTKLHANTFTGEDPRRANLCRWNSRMAPVQCRLMEHSSNRVTIHLQEPGRGIAPGQVLALYDDTKCLGGGILE